MLALDAARQRLVLVAVMVVVGTVFGTFLALIRPNEFMSTAKLMVRPGLRDSVSPESAIAGSSESRPLVIHDLVANQMQILMGPELCRKIVQLVGIDRVLEPYDPRSLDAGASWSARMMHAMQAWWFAGGGEVDPAVDRGRLAAKIIADNLRMAPEIGSNVISVSYTTHDAKLAQDIVDAALKASLEIHREAFETAASLETVEKELTSLESAAVEAEKVLLDFKVQNGIYEFEPQRRALLTYLSTLDEQVEESAVLIGTRTAEQEKLTQLKDQERGAETGTVSVMLNPAHTALLTFLNQLLIEDLQLLGLHTDPAEIQKRQQRLTAMITETRTRLEKEEPTVELTARDAGNSRRRRLETAFEDSAVTLQGLLKQRELRTTTRDDVKKRLVAFETFAQRLRGLELDATKKRQNADRLAVGLNNLRTIQRLDQLHLSNLQILYPATYLPEKIGPRRSLTLITGLFLGLVMGVGLAYGLTALDRRVRRPIDLRVMGLRVQGCIAADAHVGARTGEKDGVAALLEEAGPEIAELWARLPFDRQSKGASIAFVSDTSAADASRVAGVFAAGLALRGGQRVAYVSCSEEPAWLLQRLGSHPAKAAGWIDVLHDGLDPGAALQSTEVEGLSIIVQGSLPIDGAHPMQRAEFAAMLARLQQMHDFVIVELPTLSARPEGRAVLRMVDAVIVAAVAGRSTKAAVQAIVDSAVAAGTTLAGATLTGATPTGTT